MKHLVFPILTFFIIGTQIYTDNPNFCVFRKIKTKICRVVIPQPPQVTGVEPKVELVYDRNEVQLVR